MATVNEKMTTLANNLRDLTNTTAAMGLDAMAGHVADASQDADDADAIVEQLLSAMQEKAAGGSGGGEICDITITIPAGTCYALNACEPYSIAISGGSTMDAVTTSFDLNCLPFDATLSAKVISGSMIALSTMYAITNVECPSGNTLMCHTGSASASSGSNYKAAIIVNESGAITVTVDS